MSKIVYVHKTKGTRFVFVEHAEKLGGVITMDEQGSMTVIENRTLNRWYDVIEEEEVKAPVEAREADYVTGEEEFETVEVEVEVEPTKLESEQDLIQLREPDGRVVTYSLTRQQWRDDIEGKPELMYNVPFGVLEQMSWYNQVQQYKGEEYTAEVCLAQAMQTNLLLEALELREWEGMNLQDMSIDEIVGEAKHVYEMATTEGNKDYEYVNSSEELKERFHKHLELLKSFIEKWEVIQWQ